MVRYADTVAGKVLCKDACRAYRKGDREKNLSVDSRKTGTWSHWEFAPGIQDKAVQGIFCKDPALQKEAAKGDRSGKGKEDQEERVGIEGIGRIHGHEVLIPCCFFPFVAYQKSNYDKSWYMFLEALYIYPADSLATPLLVSI